MNEKKLNDKIRKAFEEIISGAIYSDKQLLEVFKKYNFTDEDHEALAELLHRYEDEDFELSDTRSDDFELRQIEGERFDE